MVDQPMPLNDLVLRTDSERAYENAKNVCVSGFLNGSIAPHQQTVRIGALQCDDSCILATWLIAYYLPQRSDLR